MNTATASEYTRIRYEMPSEHVARVVLARPDKANAQDKTMLYELDAAFGRAMQDAQVRAVIVAADGKHFSSGHDLKDRSRMGEFPKVTETGGFDQPGQHGHWATEEEIYVGMCWRWRNLPKPTLCAVQGKVIAGGLMLVWPFDIVIASRDASFSDPTVDFGVNGVEFFTHVWELGSRKAKEMLFTGNSFSAEECHRLGMVNHVVERDELADFTLAMAEKIAEKPAMGLKLAKNAVNRSLDIQGQWDAIQSAFGLHHMGHAHQRILYNSGVQPGAAEKIRDNARAGN